LSWATGTRCSYTILCKKEVRVRKVVGGKDKTSVVRVPNDRVDAKSIANALVPNATHGNDSCQLRMVSREMGAEGIDAPLFMMHDSIVSV
jgi:hypothetical protein